MALTAAQKIRLNGLLAQYPSSSSHPTMLADMWELLPNTAPVNAAKAEWKSETAAKLTAFQAQVDQPFTDGQDAITNA